MYTELRLGVTKSSKPELEGLSFYLGVSFETPWDLCLFCGSEVAVTSLLISVWRELLALFCRTKTIYQYRCQTWPLDTGQQNKTG